MRDKAEETNRKRRVCACVHNRCIVNVVLGRARTVTASVPMAPPCGCGSTVSSRGYAAAAALARRVVAVPAAWTRDSTMGAQTTMDCTSNVLRPMFPAFICAPFDAGTKLRPPIPVMIAVA